MSKPEFNVGDRVRIKGSFGNGITGEGIIVAVNPPIHPDTEIWGYKISCDNGVTDEHFRVAWSFDLIRRGNSHDPSVIDSGAAEYEEIMRIQDQGLGYG